MRFHAFCVITAANLQATLAEASDDRQLWSMIMLCLRTAVVAGNSRAARELVRAAMPFLLKANAAVSGGCSQNRGWMQDALVAVRELCDSDGLPAVLVPCGMLVVFFEICLGGVACRASLETAKTEAWLSKAGSYSFRLRNWHRDDPDSSLSSLLSGRAKAIRKSFLAELRSLSEMSNDFPAFFEKLLPLSQELHDCNRFSTLRTILGLDSCYHANMVHAIAALAFDIVSPSNRSPFGVDEATELEARAKLQHSVVAQFESDPLSQNDRRLRATYGMPR